jgi:hypothetical protein
VPPVGQHRRGARDWGEVAVGRRRYCSYSSYFDSTEEKTQLPDFLDQTIQEIDDRIDKLRPLVDEYARLEAASQSLGEDNASSWIRPRGGAAA